MIKGQDVYSVSIKDWTLYRAAYDGTQQLIKIPGVFDQHARESDANYARRKSQVYGYNYSRAIVEILTFYLFQVPFEPDWGFLTSNVDFDAFNADCDLWGTNFETFLDARQKQASVYGQIGIMVDKSSEGDKNARPYLTFYTPENILDWRYSRDRNGQPYLSYLKLHEEDDVEIEWTTSEWKRTDLQNSENNGSGPNLLKEIPFTWLINIPSNHYWAGISDISEIASIDASIIRNLSQIEEIGDYSAFPMMLKPETTSPNDGTQDAVGPSAVIEFDPAYPDAIPRWMESEAKEPIDAILKLIMDKRNHIYASSNTSGINATDDSSEAKSGVALQSEFQLLNAKLAVKSAYLEVCQTEIVKLWAKWQNVYSEADMETINLNRPRNFNVTNLANDLEAVIMGTGLVNSDEFNRTMQRLVARGMAGERGDYEVIDKEIKDAPVVKNDIKTRAEIDGNRAGAIDTNDENNVPGAVEPTT